MKIIDASFSEEFYGLKRSPYKNVKDRLNASQRWMSLCFMVI
jgi:hypothetical protein